MSSQTPYIGSKISLISKLDIRYEGVLYSVNTQDSTIALVKVRSLGTEDRPVSTPVAARDDVYEHIIFKASDIKDLIVCETPKPQTLGGLPYDPAIVSVSNRPEPAQSAGSSRPVTPNRTSPVAQLANRAPGAGRAPGPLPMRGAPAGVLPPRGGGYVQQRQGYQGGYRGAYSGPQPLMGAPRRGGFARGSSNPREKLRYDSDYDFEKANEQFQEALSDLVKDKLNIAEKDASDGDHENAAEGEEKEEDDEFYNKGSSFFDRISCEALEKAEGRKGRPDWRKERETNQETFGHQAVRSLNYRRGGRGMRGGPRFYGYNNFGGYQRGGYNNGGNRGGFRRPQQQPAPQV